MGEAGDKILWSSKREAFVELRNTSDWERWWWIYVKPWTNIPVFLAGQAWHSGSALGSPSIPGFIQPWPIVQQQSLLVISSDRGFSQIPSRGPAVVLKNRVKHVDFLMSRNKSIMIARWDSSLSVLPVGRAQFPTTAEYSNGFFPGWPHSANPSWASVSENGSISPHWHHTNWRQRGGRPKSNHRWTMADRIIKKNNSQECGECRRATVCLYDISSKFRVMIPSTFFAF